MPRFARDGVMRRVIAGDLSDVPRFAEEQGWRFEMITVGLRCRRFKDASPRARHGVSLAEISKRRSPRQRCRRPKAAPDPYICGDVAVLPERTRSTSISTRRSTDRRLRVGPGGQSVTPQTRGPDYPSTVGLVVIQQDESAAQDKGKAIRVLRPAFTNSSASGWPRARRARQSMVGSGDRSEEDPDYNFPRGVTITASSRCTNCPRSRRPGLRELTEAALEDRRRGWQASTTNASGGEPRTCAGRRHTVADPAILRGSTPILLPMRSTSREVRCSRPTGLARRFCRLVERRAEGERFLHHRHARL